MPSTVTGQGLQTVAAKLREIAQTRRGFQDPQPLLRLTTERFETGDPLTLSEALGPVVPIASNHNFMIPESTWYVKRTT